MMLRLTFEESAELLQVLNDVDLASHPHAQRVRARLESLQPRQSEDKDVATQSLRSEVVKSHVPQSHATPPPQALALQESQVSSQPGYTMTDKDKDKDDEFCLALDQLRRDRTQTLFGTAILHNLGPGLIMGDTVLDCIAECARTRKLRSLDDLYRETQWDQTWELGPQVLELVSRYYPRSLDRVSPGALVDSDENAD